MKTVTLYHPHSDMPIEVEDSRVEEWTEQGWLKTDPEKRKTSSTKTGETK